MTFENFSQDADLARLDAVILAACVSPLGKGHGIVQYGKKMQAAMTKERSRLEFDELERSHVEVVRVCIRVCI